MSRVSFIRGGGTCGSTHCAYDLKCWTDADDNVEWDLDRLAISLELGATKRFTFGVWVRQQWPNLCKSWTDLGLEVQQVFKPARKWSSLQQEGLDEVQLRDCATVTSSGLVGFLLHCSGPHVKSKEHRKMAVAILNSLLARASVSISRLWSDALPLTDLDCSAIYGLCNGGSDKPCTHVRSACTRLEQANPEGEQLQFIHATGSDCASLQFLCTSLVSAASVCVGLMIDKEAYSHD
eukprot:6195440-Amphidinium_carterae.1